MQRAGGGGGVRGLRWVRPDDRTKTEKNTTLEPYVQFQLRSKLERLWLGWFKILQVQSYSASTSRLGASVITRIAFFSYLF